MIPPVILASQSPRRRELLEKTGIPFSIIVRGTEELKEASMPPQELCLHNAAAKAEAVFREHPDSTVIGADTLVFLPDAFCIHMYAVKFFRICKKSRIPFFLHMF